MTLTRPYQGREILVDSFDDLYDAFEVATA